MFVCVCVSLTVFALPANAQSTTIDKISETRFANHGGSGHISNVMLGLNDKSIVVGLAYVPDPDRSGKLLTTLTYTEIAVDGKVVVERSYGRAPALSVLDSTHKDGITYIRGFNAPSLFSDSRDVWVAAIATGGKLLWRKPVGGRSSGDVKLFVEPNGRLVMAGFVGGEKGQVGVRPFTSGGVLGQAEIFGSIENDGWTYPDFIVRAHGTDGTELLFARSNKEEVRVDRLVSNKSASWNRSLAWAAEQHPSQNRPTSVSIKSLSENSIALIGRKGGVSLDKALRRYKANNLISWLLLLETDGKPSLFHVDSHANREYVDVEETGTNELLIQSNEFDIKRVSTSVHPHGVAGVREWITWGDGHPTRKKGNPYYHRLKGMNADNRANPVMFGSLIDAQSGKAAGYALVLTDHVVFGAGDNYASKLYGVFEKFIHSRRTISGDVILVTQAERNSKLKGPVFRRFRIKSASGDEL